MKVINLFICLLCMLLRLHGQTLERQVLANAGHHLDGDEMLLSYTIGEPSISLYEDGVYFVSFGFQYPDENASKITTGIAELPNSFLDFIAFPNPVVDQINLYLSSLSFEKITITITNAKGEIVVEKSGNTNETISIPFYHVAAGAYFITAETASGFSQTKKIITIK